MRGDFHVRFCERLGVRFPGATRHVVGFECKEDAEQFLEDIKERLSEFGLNLHPEKTRLIEFGRSAIEDRKRRGEGKPETFDFLGFTHYCRKTREGWFGLGRKPVAKRMTRTLKRVGEILRRRINGKVKDVAQWLGSVGRGWLGYYAVPTSYKYLKKFILRLKRKWLRVLRRRSQKDRFTWERLKRLTKAKWEPVKILHPWPDKRFAVKHLR